MAFLQIKLLVSFKKFYRYVEEVFTLLCEVRDALKANMIFTWGLVQILMLTCSVTSSWS